jgi:hypothetical protein
MSERAEGTCLCGAVTLVANSPKETFGACHCGMCRRWGGGPFLSLPCGSDVEIRGEAKVYDSSQWAERGFCATCGTHLFYRIKGGKQYHVPLGLFGDSVSPTFAVQVFIDRKPTGYEFKNETQMLTEQQIFEMYAPKS